MRIVTLDTVADRWWMNRAFQICRFLVCVAGEAKGIRRGRNQFDPSHILISSDLMATGASHLHCRMHGFALGLVFMASDASGGVSFGIKQYWMLGGEGAARGSQNQSKAC